jgi:hypothetical protein
MTFEEYWKALEQKNEHLREGNSLKMEIASFKRSLRQAFDMGVDYQRGLTSFKDSVTQPFKGFPFG